MKLVGIDVCEYLDTNSTSRGSKLILEKIVSTNLIIEGKLSMTKILGI